MQHFNNRTSQINDKTLQRTGVNATSDNATSDIVEVKLDNIEDVFSVLVFQARGRRYVLKEPTKCYRNSEEGYFVLECPEYNISGYSKDSEAAFADLNADFACRFDGLVNEANSALSQDAIEERNFLQGAVLRVEPEHTTVEQVSVVF